MSGVNPAVTPAARAGVHDYVALTKPSIMLLVLITGVTTMLIVPGHMPSFALIVATTFGTALASASANSLNMYFDRDIDVIMKRTQKRPIPAGRVAPKNALLFGIVLGVVSFVFLSVTVNLLSALIAVASILFYVVVYTLYLKRRTPQNIVIGGAAGAAPPLIAWAAVTGTVELPAILLFLLVFLWTPPHFWALALLAEEDYRRAGVPMMPVVRGQEETRKQIVLYTITLLPLTASFYFIGYAGLFFLIVGLVLGIIFLYRAWQLYKEPGKKIALNVFFYSVYYLWLIFGALVIDRLAF